MIRVLAFILIFMGLTIVSRADIRIWGGIVLILLGICISITL